MSLKERGAYICGSAAVIAGMLMETAVERGDMPDGTVTVDSNAVGIIGSNHCWARYTPKDASVTPDSIQVVDQSQGGNLSEMLRDTNMSRYPERYIPQAYAGHFLATYLFRHR